MELCRPFMAITPTLDGDILDTLARIPHGLTSGQVRNACGRGSRAGIVKALDRLVEQGVVTRESCGRIFVYELNREHLIAESLELISGTQRRWEFQLCNAIREWPFEPVLVAVVGSARTTAHQASDPIELLFVLPEGMEAPAYSGYVQKLCKISKELTGNTTVPLAHRLDHLHEVPSRQLIDWFFAHRLIIGNARVLLDYRDDAA